MLKVWGRETSINVQKVMWLVGELGLEYERVDVGGPFGGLDRPDYVAMNPTGCIPTMEDDGFTLWESHAIVRHLARKHGAGSWWPDDPRTLAVADQWMDWPYNLAYPQLIRAFLGLYRTPEDERDDDMITRALQVCARNCASSIRIWSATRTSRETRRPWATSPSVASPTGGTPWISNAPNCRTSRPGTHGFGNVRRFASTP